MTPRPLSRRTALCWLATAGVAAPGASRADQPLIKASDPDARAVGYVDDASRVDATRNPTYRPGQTCANCALYGGDPGSPRGGCQLFMGVDVVAQGWCQSWQAKAG